MIKVNFSMEKHTGLLQSDSPMKGNLSEQVPGLSSRTIAMPIYDKFLLKYGSEKNLKTGPNWPNLWRKAFYFQTLLRKIEPTCNTMFVIYGDNINKSFGSVTILMSNTSVYFIAISSAIIIIHWRGKNRR